jgi:hypothetical protein
MKQTATGFSLRSTKSARLLVVVCPSCSLRIARVKAFQYAQGDSAVRIRSSARRLFGRSSSRFSSGPKSSSSRAAR